MQFKEVLGNGELKSRLINMVDSGRTGHSLMFVEKDGYGALPLGKTDTVPCLWPWP